MRLLSILVLFFCLQAPAWADTPADITAAQERLSTLGFNPGPIDGKMGPRTRQAIKKFQRSKNLRATGRLDDPTEFELGMGAKLAGLEPDASNTEIQEVSEQEIVAAEPVAEAEPEPEPEPEITPEPESIEPAVEVADADEAEAEPVRKAVGVTLELGLEFGGDELSSTQFMTGSSETVDAGEGISAAIGGYFRLGQSNISLKSSVGYKFGRAGSENGDANFSRLVVDLLARYHFAQNWRIGLGPTYHFNNELDVDLAGGSSTIDFDNQVGVTAELQWGYIGLTYTAIEYEAEANGEKFDGNSGGLFLMADF